MEKYFAINDISLKAKSKKKVYQVFIYEGGIYLPPILDANKNYIKDITTDKKMFLYWMQILTVKLPHIGSLSIKLVINFVIEWTNINDYLPTYKYNKLPNRDWLWNVVNTLANKEFSKFIQDRFAKREKCMVTKKRLGIEAIHEIVSIFANLKMCLTWT